MSVDLEVVYINNKCVYLCMYMPKNKSKQQEKMHKRTDQSNYEASGYLQIQREVENCENERHEQDHHVHRIDQSRSPFDSPIAGSHHCEDSQVSMVSCCGNSIPSLCYFSSRISLTSFPLHDPIKFQITI